MSFRSVIAAVTGTAGAQAIGLVFVPMLTQIYSPAAFGYVGFILAIAAILLPISTLSLPVAIVVAKNEEHSRQLSSLALMFTVIVTFVTLLFIWFFNDWLRLSLNDKSVAQYFYWIPLAVFFCACLEIADYWSIRKESFSVRAKVAVANSLMINGGKLLLGLLWATPVSLLLLTLINPILNAVLLVFGSMKNRNVASSIGALFYCEAFDWRERVTEYKAFPLFQAPQAFMNAISKGGPILVLGSFFGADSAGFYGLSYTILMVPVALISKAVGDVFYSRIAKVDSCNIIRTHFLRYTSLLACLGFIPLFIIQMWGPYLFTLIFGDLWLQAGIYAQWLSIWSFFIFINSPSLKAIIVLEKQKIAMVINMITMPLRLLALLFGAYFFQSEKVALLCFVFISIGHNIIIIFLAYKASCTQKMNVASFKREVQ
jgi:O-antigen/teichoic acid export membrane protein